MVVAASAVVSFACHHVGADAPRTVAAEVTAHPPKDRPGIAAVRRTCEGDVVAAEQPAADLGVDVGRQDVGELKAVVVERVVKEGPVGDGTVGEIVGVQMDLVEVPEGPQRPPGLDPCPVRQTGARQRLDVELLHLQFDRLARRDFQRDRRGPEELVVHIPGQRKFGVAQRETFDRTFGPVSHLESGRREGLRLGRVSGIQDHADRGIEDIVRGECLAPHRGDRWLCGLGRGSRHRLKLPFQGLDAGLVFLLDGLDLGSEFLCRRCRILGVRLERDADHDGREACCPQSLDDGAHVESLFLFRARVGNRSPRPAQQMCRLKGLRADSRSG